MNERGRDTEQTYLVQCIWCGSTIRDAKEEEATGVCLKCFYQILNNHLGTQKKAMYGEFVSDR